MFNSCVLVFDLAIALIIILEYVSWTYQSFAPPTPIQARWRGNYISVCWMHQTRLWASQAFELAKMKGNSLNCFIQQHRAVQPLNSSRRCLLVLHCNHIHLALLPYNHRCLGTMCHTCSTLIVHQCHRLLVGNTIHPMRHITMYLHQWNLLTAMFSQYVHYDL